MYKITSLVLLLAGGVAFTACNKDDDTPTTDNTVRLTAILNGQQEKPNPTPSTATGTFTGTIDKTTRVLTYEVAYQGFTATMGHLHKGGPTVAGPVDIGFASVATSPIRGTTAPLAQSKIDSMTNGLYYANLHSALYPGGEIRGNITKVP